MTPIRFIPILVLFIFGGYLLHTQYKCTVDQLHFRECYEYNAQIYLKQHVFAIRGGHNVNRFY